MTYILLPGYLTTTKQTVLDIINHIGMTQCKRIQMKPIGEKKCKQ